MKNQKSLFIGIIVVLVAILAGLATIKASDQSMRQGTTTLMNSTAVATNAVAIQDYMFSPMVIKVKLGTMVTWTNKDSVHHSVNADTPSNNAPSSNLFGQNQTYKFTFMKAGTYLLHCDAHPYMHATVIVTSS